MHGRNQSPRSAGSFQRMMWRIKMVRLFRCLELNMSFLLPHTLFVVNVCLRILESASPSKIYGFQQQQLLTYPYTSCIHINFSHFLCLRLFLSIRIIFLWFFQPLSAPFLSPGQPALAHFGRLSKTGTQFKTTAN